MTHLPRSPVSRSAFLAAAAGLVLMACGGDTGASTIGSPVTAPVISVPPAVTSVAPGAASSVPAPLIGATTIYGDSFDASSLLGRPTVAWFWAPWCVICRGEGPDVAEIAARYEGRVNFIGVAGLGATSDMRDFVAETGTGEFTHLDDASGAIWSSYGIYSQPAFAFIDSDGRLETYVGSLGFDGLVDIVDQLLVA